MKRNPVVIAVVLLAIVFVLCGKGNVFAECFDGPRSEVCVPDTAVVFLSEKLIQDLKCYEGGSEKYICVNKKTVVTDENGKTLAPKKINRGKKKKIESENQNSSNFFAVAYYPALDKWHKDDYVCIAVESESDLQANLNRLQRGWKLVADNVDGWLQYKRNKLCNHETMGRSISVVDPSTQKTYNYRNTMGIF